MPWQHVKGVPNGTSVRQICREFFQRLGLGLGLGLELELELELEKYTGPIVHFGLCCLWRSKIFIVSDRSLKELCIEQPQSPLELHSIHGFGKLKVEKFGEQFLEAL